MTTKVVERAKMDYILKFFSYDPETGVITRTDRKNSDGSLDKDGYLCLKIKGEKFKSHRVAWFLYYGTFPGKEIDHINRNRKDNRITNLREVDRRENVLNSYRKPNPITGVVGVYKDCKTKGLKRVYTTHLNRKTYRFLSLAEAVEFRINNNLPI
jgi:hypothetical protein